MFLPVSCGSVPEMLLDRPGPLSKSTPRCSTVALKSSEQSGSFIARKAASSGLESFSLPARLSKILWLASTVAKFTLKATSPCLMAMPAPRASNVPLPL